MITPIIGKIQNYEWGKSTDGMVYQIHQSNQPTPINPSHVKFAEYWMGTHPNACSTLPNHQLLSTITQLPFLFKVLSIQKALSIQAHPDKPLAEYLHKTDPTHYKDDNHKPEMCIALNTFEALSGFCSESDYQMHLNLVPEIKSLNVKHDLKSLFTSLMNATTSQMTEMYTKLMHRIESDTKYSQHPLISLIIRLNAQYPNDVGIFCPIFMNHITLNQYEALFMSANEPHAYLSGDCMECMANSDNVVRAGLTPKFRDVDTLLNMLSWKQYSKQDLIVKPIQNGPIWKYQSLVDEFDIYKIDLTQDIKESDTVFECHRDAILIVMEGHGSLKCKSDTFQIKKGNSFYFNESISFNGPLLAFIAYK
eukprot:NODE_210_length_12844_cov_1.045822.p2 type:complete len:365 gc:universal NODE_210_length_12844_cov_1.045822:8028-6934(-)